MKQTIAETIRTHTYGSKWKKAVDNWTCVYIKCIACGKEYRYNSGKAIAKHELRCKKDLLEKYYREHLGLSPDRR